MADGGLFSSMWGEWSERASGGEVLEMPGSDCIGRVSVAFLRSRSDGDWMRIGLELGGVGKVYSMQLKTQG
jgi:hypothetical protein